MSYVDISGTASTVLLLLVYYDSYVFTTVFETEVCVFKPVNYFNILARFKECNDE